MNNYLSISSAQTDLIVLPVAQQLNNGKIKIYRI